MCVQDETRHSWFFLCHALIYSLPSTWMLSASSHIQHCQTCRDTPVSFPNSCYDINCKTLHPLHLSRGLDIFTPLVSQLSPPSWLHWLPSLTLLHCHSRCLTSALQGKLQFSVLTGNLFSFICHIFICILVLRIRPQAC